MTYLKLIDRRSDLPHALSLWQFGYDNFTVIYGKQIRRDLTYSAAAEEYGLCLMHALACQGKMQTRRTA